MIKPLDTHSAVKQLQTTGMDEAQAETIVNVVKGLSVGDLATKADINDVVQETTAIRSEIKDLKVEMAEFKTEIRTEVSGLKQEMAEFKTEIRTEVSGLRQEMAKFKTEIRTEVGNVRTEIAEVKNEIASARAESKADIALLRNEFIWVRRLLMVVVLAIVSAVVKYIFF